MGNSSNSLKGLNSRYQQIGIEENQLLSTLVVVKQKQTEEKLLIKQMTIASEAEYNRRKKEFIHRKNISDKKLGRYLIRVRDFEGKEQTQMCGKSFKLMLYLQYLTGTLKTVFIQRLRSHQPFEQDELLRLLRSIVKGIIILHDNSYKNVHLSKEAIAISSENTYKLIDTQLCNRVHPYFAILNGVPPKAGTYIAPEQLADIRKGAGQYYYSAKADLYSLAVLVLELATLNMMDKYYDYSAKTVDCVGLRKVAEGLPMSGYFKDILLCMLLESQQQRVGLLSLQQMLTNNIQSTLNDESMQYRSMCEPNKEIKHSARTFITRTNNEETMRNTQSFRSARNQHSKLDLQSRQTLPNPKVTQYRNYPRQNEPQHVPEKRCQPPMPSSRQVPAQVVRSTRQPQPLPPSYVSIQSQDKVATSHQFNFRIPMNRPVSQPQQFSSHQHFSNIVIPSTSPIYNAPPREPEPRRQQLVAHKIQPPLPNPIVLNNQNDQISAKITQSVHVTEKITNHNTNTLKVHTPAATPKTHTFQGFKKVNTREFQTPIERITQHQQLTTVTKIQDRTAFLQKHQESMREATKVSNRTYGHLDFENGARYQGQFNPQSEFQGNGVLYYPSGKICYSGSWKGNCFNGFGVLYNQKPTQSVEITDYAHFNLSELNWTYYQGEFSMDHKDGFGTLHIANGDKFSGCFKNDVIEGFGSFYLKSQKKNINGIWSNNVLKL